MNKDKITQNYLLYQMILFFFIAWNAMYALKGHWGNIFNVGWETSVSYIIWFLSGFIIGGIVKLIRLKQPINRLIQIIVGIIALILSIILNFSTAWIGSDFQLILVTLLMFAMTFFQSHIDFECIAVSQPGNETDPKKNKTNMINYGHWIAGFLGITSISAVAFVNFPVNTQLMLLVSFFIMAICLILSSLSILPNRVNSIVNKKQTIRRRNTIKFTDWLRFGIVNLLRHLFLIGFYAVFIFIFLSDRTSSVMGFLLDIEDHGILTTSNIIWLVAIGMFLGVIGMFLVFFLGEKLITKKLIGILIGLALEGIFITIFLMIFFSPTNFDLLTLKTLLMISSFSAGVQIPYISLGQKVKQLRILHE